MKTTFSSIKKVLCAAAIFSAIGMSLFAASPKSSAPATVKESTVSIPKDAALLTICGKVKVSKKNGETVLTFKTISDNKYSIVVVDPLTTEELVEVKGKKLYLSGYLTSEEVFYVIKIGMIPSDGSAGSAK